MTAAEVADSTSENVPRSWLSRWWVIVLGIYAASRVFTVAIDWYAWRTLPPDQKPRFPSFAHYLGFLWDGEWYHEIATIGYPSVVPGISSGDVEQNAWAFFPLYPFTARAIMTVTGLPWNFVGPALSMTFGAAAMLMLFHLIRTAAPDAVAARPELGYFAVIGMSMFLSSPVFNLAYADSLALLLLLSALLLLNRRRYGSLVGILVLLGLTRPIALPFALVVGWHGLRRWHDGRAGRDEPPSRRTLISIAAVAVIAVITGFLWPIIAAIVLGDPGAYFTTQHAWHSASGYSTYSLGWASRISTIKGWVWLIAIIVFIAASLNTKFVRGLGPELQAWLGAYMAFLIATPTLGMSLPRYLLLVVVLQLALVKWARGPWRLGAMIVFMAAFQVAWVLATMPMRGTA